ncbi:hypothetical protein E1A91_A05G267700v1 [Gossypium mustelinum]|uniref:Uncharacterized protein n=1 Tax=Gossypium mustelinum TaxID=34275 RepID=A0A5D2ZDE7_GOSMU|nr:hypothetical protein E1A91_A05G267700v1 [Gossypium mustelinum]
MAQEKQSEAHRTRGCKKRKENKECFWLIT